MAAYIGRRVLFTLIAGAVVAGSAATVAAARVNASESVSPQAASGSCRAGSKPAVIAGRFKCLKAGQACAGRYQAAYKRYGFTCVRGHLRRRPTAPPAPPSPPPPAPPPAPPAQAGHYKGTTSQNELIEFDVNAAGNTVQNVSTGQINEGCNPGGTLSAGNFSGGSAAIAADGTFKIDFDYRGTVSGVPSTGHFTITGKFSGSAATGTLQKTTAFTYNGVQYSCGSGLQNWTVTRLG